VIVRSGWMIAIVMAVSLSGTEGKAQEDWQSAYELGDAIELKITDSIWQDCAVSENPPGGTMRVMCEEYVEPAPGTYRRAGGRYIVYGESDVRRPGVDPAAPAAVALPAPAVAAAPAVRSAPATAAASNPPAVAKVVDPKPVAVASPDAPATGLRVGEYACYGSSGRILAGFGFKVLSGGRYTDLEGGNAGSYVVRGDRVTFRGGHLGGMVGRDLRGASFSIRDVACEPF